MDKSIAQPRNARPYLLLFIISIFGCIDTTNAQPLAPNFTSSKDIHLAFHDRGGRHGTMHNNQHRSNRGAHRNNLNKFHGNKYKNYHGTNVKSFHKNNYKNYNGTNVNVYRGAGINTNGINRTYYYRGMSYPNLFTYCQAACIVLSNGHRSCPNVCH